jgi:zinc transport system substrate-binding protein
MEVTRRKLLSGVAGSAASGLLAGCVGGDSGNGSGATTAEASFFVFGDMTTQVAGDTAEGSLLVPVGQHGHGWEPGASVRRDIREADLLVHGMAGFQPWVDNIKTDLEADDATVQAIDISRDVSLLEAGAGGHDHSGDGDHQGEDSDHHNGGEDGDHHGGENGHHDGGEGGDHHNDSDSERGMDPHFWMDPLRLKTAVDTVSEGLAEVDPGNEDTYAENAESLKGDLDDLHEQIETTVANASKNTLLVAGHNSFQYFSARYGVDVAALTNVSPDDRPTLSDRERAQEVIDRHGLQYICADPIESQQAATQLVEDTDAEEVLSLTAMPGLTDEWESEDWGYVEIMKNVNLPTLERVLDA